MGDEKITLEFTPQELVVMGTLLAYATERQIREGVERNYGPHIAKQVDSLAGFAAYLTIYDVLENELEIRELADVDNDFDYGFGGVV